MQITVVGINHKTAGIDILERAVFNTTASSQALEALKTAWPGGEFALLSTCNRMECYAVTDLTAGPEPFELAKFLFGLRNLDYEQIRDTVYIKKNEDAVRHLLTVASTLDSMVIGENQIIAQVKDSYALACAHQSCGKILNHLFHVAFHTAKEIFSTTSIANRRVSIAGVAVELAKQLFSDIRSAKIVVAGAGQMGQLLIQHFQQLKCGDITIMNRSAERGCQVAQEHGVHYGAWEDMEQQLIEANIIIGAVSAHEGYVFNKEMFKKIMHRRKNRLLLLIDIAVPRCFEPSIDQIDSVYLYSIDDLGQVVQDNIKLREGELEHAIEIICRHVAEFMDWLATRDLGPLIEEMKKAFDGIRDAELNNFFKGLKCPADCRGELEFSVRSVVNKLAHCIVKNIEFLAKKQGSSEAQRLAQGIVEHAQRLISDEKDTK